MFPKQIINECILNCSLSTDDFTDEPGCMYLKFIRNSVVKINFNWKYNHFTEEGMYTSCLVNILEKLPQNSVIKFTNNLQLQCDKKVHIIKLDELYTLHHTGLINIQLKCHHIDGTVYLHEGLDEFDTVFLELQQKMHCRFLVCMNCCQSNITSISDLRYGWYCFRDIKNQKRELPWFERNNEFQESISNVNALHWCPNYCDK